MKKKQINIIRSVLMNHIGSNLSEENTGRILSDIIDALIDNKIITCDFQSHSQKLPLLGRHEVEIGNDFCRVVINHQEVQFSLG